MTRGAAGFTLLEVLVAFVILAMTMGAMMQIFGNGMRGAASAREYAEATFIAQALLDRMGRSDPVTFGVQAGQDRRYAWEIDVAEYADAGLAPTPATPPFLIPARIRVTVRWGDRDHRVDLVTLRLVEPDING